MAVGGPPLSRGPPRSQTDYIEFGSGTFVDPNTQKTASLDDNGRVAAKLIPNVRLVELSGVKHYDFLAACTPAGQAAVDLCKDELPQDPTHKAALDAALAFFGSTLGKPPV